MLASRTVCLDYRLQSVPYKRTYFLPFLLKTTLIRVSLFLSSYLSKSYKPSAIYTNILNFSDAFTEVWILLTFDFLSELLSVTLLTNLVNGHNKIIEFPISSFCILSTCCLSAKPIVPVYLYITSESSFHKSLIRQYTQ